MVLKDASAYNVQFRRGLPILIDTLSFETYQEGEPWIAYRQFCGHFLAPLALMALVDVRLNSLLRTHIDGVPLDLASHLLPGTTRLKPGLQGDRRGPPVGAKGDPMGGVLRRDELHRCRDGGEASARRRDARGRSGNVLGPRGEHRRV